MFLFHSSESVDNGHCENRSDILQESAVLCSKSVLIEGKEQTMSSCS